MQFRSTLNLRQIAFVTTVMVAALLVRSDDVNAQRTRKAPRSQAAKVVVGNYGYEPASLRLRKGIRARVTFLRTSESTCATEVVFADYGIRRELPLNQPVTVTFTPMKAGEFSFTCGMNMHRGKLIVS